MTTKKKLGTVCFYVVAILLAVIAMIPFLWMISTSFKSRGALMSIPIQWIPEEPTLAAYIKVFSKFPFARTIGNSLFISVSYTIITLLSSSMGGFRFCKAPVSGEQPALAVLSCNHDDSNPGNDDSIVRCDESHGAY